MTFEERRVMARAEIQRRAAALGERLGVPCRLDAPLAPLTSMRVGGPVAALLSPASAEAVAACVRCLASDGVPHRLLGGGSNLVAADRGLDFAVVEVAASAGAARFDGPRACVPAGLPLASLLREAHARGLSGLEWAAGLPGSVGGAVFGNAGAFGGEIGASVRAVTLLREGGTIERREVQAGDFAYRSSFVGPRDLLLDVEIDLRPADPAVVRAEADRVNRARAASQPKGGHSSGCVFRNPEGISAGRLIDECGLKGRRRGGAFVSPAHANFIVNDGSATAADVLGLMDEVVEEVRRKTGVRLQLEVTVWKGTGEEGAS